MFKLFKRSRRFDAKTVAAWGSAVGSSLEEWLIPYSTSTWAMLKGDDPPPVDTEFVIEVTCFTAHILDRLAFERWGESGRDVFIDAMCDGVTPFIEPNGVSEAGFQSRYNLRTAEWSQFKKAYAERDAPLAGTLCWEFSKSLSEQFNQWNPVRPGLLCGQAMDCILAMGDLLERFKA